MKHLMLDLETMGTKPGCAIVSIGAVQFDLDSGAIGKKFYGNIDLESSQKAGLDIDAKTVLWWLKQNDNARNTLTAINALPLEVVLNGLKHFIEGNEITILWGNSASFDCAILAEAYRKCGMVVPWFYYHEKCYRTVTTLFPINCIKKDEAKAHDPIYDCEYQIGKLLATMNSLKNKNYV